jgi:hypothetical protein
VIVVGNMLDTISSESFCCCNFRNAGRILDGIAAGSGKVKFDHTPTATPLSLAAAAPCFLRNSIRDCGWQHAEHNI